MVYYNPYYTFLLLWSLVWTLEVKNDKGLPLYPGKGYASIYKCKQIGAYGTGSPLLLRFLLVWISD